MSLLFRHFWWHWAPLTLPKAWFIFTIAPVILLPLIVFLFITLQMVSISRWIWHCSYYYTQWRKWRDKEWVRSRSEEEGFNVQDEGYKGNMDTHINTQTQAGRQRLIISATLAVCTVVLIEAFKRIASVDTRRPDERRTLRDSQKQCYCDEALGIALTEMHWLRVRLKHCWRYLNLAFQVKKTPQKTPRFYFYFVFIIWFLNCIIA